MYVTCTVGHHKDAKTLAGRHWLLRAFYGVYPFFAYLCVGTEACGVAQRARARASARAHAPTRDGCLRARRAHTARA